MRTARLRLEEFEAAGAETAAAAEARRAQEAALAAAREAARAEGYAEGYAAGAAETEAQTRRALSALRESLQDLDLTLAAARTEAVAAVGPALLAALTATAPEAARAGLAEAVALAVAERLAAAPEARLTVRVAPAQAEGLAERLGDLAEIRADPALGTAEAMIDWEGGGARYDAGACAEAALAALRCFFSGEDQRELRNAG